MTDPRIIKCAKAGRYPNHGSTMDQPSQNEIARTTAIVRKWLEQQPSAVAKQIGGALSLNPDGRNMDGEAGVVYRGMSDQAAKEIS